MTLNEYLKSAKFQAVQDEALRDAALRAAENILREHVAVKRHQLHAIPSIIQGAGLLGLREMAQKQKEKNSNSKNKAFWSAIDDLLSATSVSEVSLYRFLQTLLLESHFVESEETSADKNTQKQIRRRNKVIIEGVMDDILDVYFEHFNCHYFFKIQQGGSQ